MYIFSDKHGKVGHCKIYNERNIKYGFSQGHYPHNSLKELVIHYYRESLVEHNKDLDVKLLYPAGATGSSSGGGHNTEYLYFRMHGNQNQVPL